MNVSIVPHPYVLGLFLMVNGDVEVCFERASFEPEESKLLLERDDEIITARVHIESQEQLAVWEKAFSDSGIELERLDLEVEE